MITLGHKTSFIFVNGTISIHADIKNYTTGNNQFFIHQWNIDFSVVEDVLRDERIYFILLGQSPLFWGGDFGIAEIDRGIQMDDEEPEEGR